MPSRISFRFSLRNLLIALLVLGIAITIPRYRSMSQRYAARVLAAKGVQLEIADHGPQPFWSWVVYGDNHYNYVTQIIIQDTDLTAADASKLLTFPYVRHVYISNCPSSAKLLDRIAECKWMNSIGIEGSPISQRHIDELAKLDLGSLEIRDPPQADFQLSVIYSTETSGLYSVMLAGKAITDANLRDVANLVGLRLLGIDDARISDAGLTALAKSKHLTRLRINNCPITGSTLGCLAACPLLEEFNAQRTLIDSAGVDEIIKVRSLHSIELQSTKVTVEDTLKLKSALPCILFSDFTFQ